MRRQRSFAYKRKRADAANGLAPLFAVGGRRRKHR